MPTPLEDFSTSSLVKAMEANTQQAWRRLGQGLGAEMHEEPDMLWFLSRFPFYLANGIVRTQLQEHAVEERFKQFAAYHVPTSWLVSPSTEPASLGSYLQQQGWARYDAPGMAMDLQSLDQSLLQPSRLKVTHVSDGEQLKAWLRVMTVGSEVREGGLELLLDVAARRGMPGPAIHYYLGTLDDQPVASSLLCLDAGVAGIYCVATLPEARRQGFGSALTIAPLLHAYTLGYRIGILQATDPGFNLYRRLGFRQYCTFQVYSSPQE